MYAKCYQNIPCGSRIMSISLNANERTDSHSHYGADPRAVQLNNCDAFNLNVNP